MRLQALVLLLFSFSLVKVARSQSNELLIQGQTGKLYLEHTVVAKENWYSVGRLYNANPKEIAVFNHRTLTQPLTIGENLQIPLTATNFSQNDHKLASETLIPVYHIIQEKEWLYRISINHNKVPVPSLEKWNNINKDQAKAGMHLIVGFLKVKTALSALATTPTSDNPPVKGKALLPPAPVPAAATTTTTSTPAVTAPVNTNPQPALTNTATTATTTAAVPSVHFNGGFFRADFSETGKSASGQAGIFKSTSGWQDGKYYALMNNAPVGTIVKISLPGTDKSVYAKVLGQLPDMKESAGLTIRISNAAAAELGTGEGHFNVEVKY
jgi:hypothetical protein